MEVHRAKVFLTDSDRRTYLKLLNDNLVDAKVRVVAFCLMTNHVHWAVIPEREDSLAVLFRRVHGRYAQYFNARHGRSGHLWQNRYFSCAISRSHLWNALRYVELNPVRAKLTTRAELYRWSIPAAHLKGPDEAASGIWKTLDWSLWQENGGIAGWRDLLAQAEGETETAQFRRCTYSGKPFGSDEFVCGISARFGRTWLSRGRPRKLPRAEKVAERSLAIANSG